MLRSLVLVLVVANALFFAWTRGGLPWLGPLPQDHGREAFRMAREVEPSRIVLAPPEAAGSAASVPAPGVAASAAAAGASVPADVASAAAPGPAPGGEPAAASAAVSTIEANVAACLEAGPFSDSEMPAIEASLSGVLAKGDWVKRSVGAPGVWLIYMGPFGSQEETLRKEGELRKLAVAFEEVRNPSELAPGLSLGRYTEQQRAQDRLTELHRKGIQTARVISASGPKTLQTIRLPAVDARQQKAIAQLPDGALRGKSLVPCATPTPAP